jgi:hypothetical protein
MNKLGKYRDVSVQRQQGSLRIVSKISGRKFGRLHETKNSLSN